MTTTTPYTTELETVNDIKIQRMNAEHYKMLSFSVDRIYDIKYNHDIKRWECNCPDVRYNKNFLCKHVTVLRVWIRAAEAEAAAKEANTRAETAEATAQEEQEQRESTSRKIYNLSNNFANIIEEQSTVLQCALLQIELLKREQAEQISQQAAEMKELRDAIRLLQKRDEQNAALVAASAQLIQAMSSQSQQQAPAPQERKITISIDGDATVKKTASKAAAKIQPEESIEEVKMKNGNVGYLVDKKHIVHVGKDSKGRVMVMGCECPMGSSTKYCDHGKRIDALLGSDVR